MPVFKCKMCGASLEVGENQTIATCEYCGTKQTLPKLNDDLKAQMYDRANHFRRNNDFDKAESIYEQILEKDNTDAEVYWSLVLCRYGVEYVEDPQTHKRIPTVNRTQFTSIFDDEDYKSAIKYADSNQRTLYEQEAKMINDIQKNILAISKNEEPFDVFICYKETDNSGRRTPDSVLANDIYHQLTQEGFKVFFSRITLEDKLGTAYEPYIFAALNSAKVMIVLGTKPEYFNAVWVKNEWSRYLKLVQKSNGKKILIPAYRDMDPYDLPDEFSHLQAQDMSKIGFMQDLIRGIKKIVEEEPQVQNNVSSHSSDNSQVAPLLKRISLFLEDGEWNNADEYCERVLDIDPENGEAYLYKLMVELEVRKREKLCLCDEPFDESENYKKIIRFGNQELIDEVNGYIHYIRCEKTWYNADWLADCAAKEKGEEAIKKYEEAYNEFISIKDFKEEGDPEQRAKECLEKINEVKYSMAEDLFNQDKIESVEQATQYYESLGDYNNSRERIIDCQNKIKDLQIKAEELEILRKQRAEERRLLIAKRNRKIKKYTVIVAPIVVIITIVCVIAFVFVIPNAKYNKAVTLMNSGNYTEAIELFDELEYFKDSTEKIKECEYNLKKEKYDNAVILMNDKKYQEALELFLYLKDFEDSDDMANKCKESINDLKYNEALTLVDDGKYDEAYAMFEELGNYKDSEDQLFLTRKKQLNSFKVGDTVSFGTDIYNSNQIEWEVLQKNGNKILLFAKNIVDFRGYDYDYGAFTIDYTITYENSAVREYINSKLYDSIFSAEEKNLISTNYMGDKMFLLSSNEVRKYFTTPKERIAISSEYDEPDDWWLSDDCIEDKCVFVDFQTGEIIRATEDIDMPASSKGIRPAIWLDLN